jgi:hypothetical protein
VVLSKQRGLWRAEITDAGRRYLASLDAAEKAHLYRLADVPTVYAGTALPEELQVILDHLESLPGVVLSARYDLLAHNKLYEALCPGFLLGERNVARRVFPYPAVLQHLPPQLGRPASDGRLPVWGLCEESR